MKTHLIKTLLFLFTTLILVPCMAQQEGIVTFNYDANGNRTTRSINFRKVCENGKDIEVGGPILTEATDVFAYTTVSIYPNPTKGIVFLSLESKEKHHLLKMRLANASGAILQEKYLEGNLESIDLSSQPAGVYLLQLTTDTEASVWKIIKN